MFAILFPAAGSGTAAAAAPPAASTSTPRSWFCSFEKIFKLILKIESHLNKYNFETNLSIKRW